MTFYRIVQGMKECHKNGDTIAEIVITESLKDEILDDANYATSVGEVGEFGYGITVGDADYILSDSGTRYEIPDE